MKLKGLLSEQDYEAFLASEAAAIAAQAGYLSLADFIEQEFNRAIAAVEGDLVPVPHMRWWADEIEAHRMTALVAFRGSLKSTLTKAKVAHALRHHAKGAFDSYFVSHNQRDTEKHLRRLKEYLNAEDLPRKWGWSEDTAAKTIMRYTRPGASFQCEPRSIDSGARGMRADLLVIDDPIDPRKPGSTTDIDSAKEAITKRLLPLLKNRDSEVVFAGTPITPGDIVSWVEGNQEFHTIWLPSIKPVGVDVRDQAEIKGWLQELAPSQLHSVYDIEGEATWPEKWPIEVLEKWWYRMEDNDGEVVGGKAAFLSEYMLLAVAPTMSYIDPELIKKAMS